MTFQVILRTPEGFLSRALSNRQDKVNKAFTALLTGALGEFRIEVVDVKQVKDDQNAKMS